MTRLVEVTSDDTFRRVEDPHDGRVWLLLVKQRRRWFLCGRGCGRRRCCRVLDWNKSKIMFESISLQCYRYKPLGTPISTWLWFTRYWKYVPLTVPAGLTTPLNMMLLILSASLWSCDEFTSESDFRWWNLQTSNVTRSHLNWHFLVPFALASPLSMACDEAWLPSSASASAASCWWHSTISGWRVRMHWSRRSCSAWPGSAFLSSQEMS